jgi:hypothetical protein
VNVELHRAFVAHLQQEGLAHFFLHDVGTFHNLIDFERLLAERPQDIFSIIQHDYAPTGMSDADLYDVLSALK